MRKRKIGIGAASLLCVAIGLVLGFVVLLVVDPSGAGVAFVTMLQNFFYFPRADVALEYFGGTLVQAAPLSLCAISVIYAKSAGLFNIGASGQFTAGAIAALYLAIACNCPWWVCLPAAILAGGIAGALAGLLKAYRSVNEVISGILMNWILLYTANTVLTPYTDSNTYTLDLVTNRPDALIPSLGLDRLFSGNETVTLALLLTPALAFLAKFILARTRLGFETRAVGLNPAAAELSGMFEKRNVVITMFIAGAFSGAAAGTLFLSGAETWQCSAAIVPSIGFNGIAAAYLGALDPFGALLASYFISHIQQGSLHMDRLIYPQEVASLVIAVTIYASAFAAFLSQLIAKRSRKEAAS